MDILGLRRHRTGTVRRLEVRLPSSVNGLGIEPLAQYPKIRRRIAVLRRFGTEVDYRKYRDPDHAFRLSPGRSAEDRASTLMVLESNE
jgi:hypothetical protein